MIAKCHIYPKHLDYFACWLFFLRFRLLTFFTIIFFSKIISSNTSKCQTVWIQIRPDILLVPIWVQTVWNGYQQTTNVTASKERSFDFCLIRFLTPQSTCSSHVKMGLPGLSQYLAEDKVSCSRTQCSASDEARTRNPSISRRALYHWATGIPK